MKAAKNKKLAIIVPYTENRLDEMYKFSGHMEYFLEDKMDYDIHFINQKYADLYFNYGKLCNIGFDLTKDDNDYFVFHDIDILPKDERCDYWYSDKPTHLCTNLRPYADWIGGAFKINKQQFQKINGFSNDYWGGVFHWNDLHYRLNKHEYLTLSKFFTKNLYKPHILTDNKLANREIKKTIYPFLCTDNVCGVIKSNKITDLTFNDSFTISANVYINDNQIQNACIIGKKGYDIGLFVMKNEAIVAQIWNSNKELQQIWFPHRNYCNEWVNIGLTVDLNNSEMILYLNGKDVSRLQISSNIMNSATNDVWVGSLEYKNNLRGKISELLIFDYALKQSEIQKIYVDGYREKSTTFEPVINIPFDKRFGDFYVDISKKSRSNMRGISTGLISEIEVEDINVSYKFNMPEESPGFFEILENSKKFLKLDNYKWDEKDDNFIENEKIFFYEIASGVLNTDNFGLNTLSYDLKETKKIKENIFIHSIKI